MVFSMKALVLALAMVSVNARPHRLRNAHDGEAFLTADLGDDEAKAFAALGVQHPSYDALPDEQDMNRLGRRLDIANDDDVNMDEYMEGSDAPVGGANDFEEPDKWDGFGSDGVASSLDYDDYKNDVELGGSNDFTEDP
eukprot:gnl/TRDRNA2_/TRDRNA2_37809_c0_seq1.p1 gnl/TRDRNA2_/TRDRNA2_37809_c0~~gnl/TRDRNA2_/TRDRNA2_37809_c0_seq1.p1  ORF type:complete len:139 (-),score=36.55 gnl/TRDRNA2_/TRDRNA2_37809_c0_seq1:122-538(-)